MPLTHHWTSKDLEAFPPAEGTRYEIIDGELYVSHQPSWHHQYTCSALIAALHTWSQATGLGAATGAPGILFAEDQDVAPDVVWISHTRLQGTLDPAGHLTCAPELVIEVLSPGRTNVRRDREVKLGLYGRQGVDEYWIVDPVAQTLDVYRQQGGRLAHVDYLTGADTLLSPVLPGFACPVGTLFAQAEPGPRGDAPDG
jgi:Uma2 family endonuclease